MIGVITKYHLAKISKGWTNHLAETKHVSDPGKLRFRHNGDSIDGKVANVIQL